MIDIFHESQNTGQYCGIDINLREEAITDFLCRLYFIRHVASARADILSSI